MCPAGGDVREKHRSRFRTLVREKGQYLHRFHYIICRTRIMWVACVNTYELKTIRVEDIDPVAYVYASVRRRRPTRYRLRQRRRGPSAGRRRCSPLLLL